MVVVSGVRFTERPVSLEGRNLLDPLHLPPFALVLLIGIFPAVTFFPSSFSAHLKPGVVLVLTVSIAIGI